MRSPRSHFNWVSALRSLGLACHTPKLVLAFFLLPLFLLAQTAHAQGFDLQQYFEQNNNQTFHDKNEFYQKFPYDSYLQSVSFTDFKTLQKDRYFLYTRFNDGDEFLYRLAERFLNLYPIANTVDDLNNKITIGELYLTPHKNPKKGFGHPKLNDIYVTIGYFILNKVGQKIGREILAKRYDENEPERAKIIDRLVNDRVYISREESAASKIVTNLQKWNWRYFWQRFHSLLYTHKDLTQRVTIGAMLFSVLLIIIGRKLRFVKGLAVLLFLVALVPLAVLKFELQIEPSVQAGPVPAQTNLQLVSARNFYPNGNGADHAVTVYKLLLNNVEIGQAIWMSRPAIQTSYIAFENVPARYSTFKANNKVALATTGGYTNAAHQPEGFTTEEGNIVNPVMMPDRHGLAMISKGGINVLDLKNQNFLLPDGGPTIDSPLDSLLAYAQLLKWCEEKHATIFQTHLLAYSDNLRINPQKANPEMRERRILALASDKKTQQVYHVIFNVKEQCNLAQITSEIFGLLQTRNLKVEAMLNLDVGAFNILNVYDDNGNLLQDVKGPIDINDATNLLVYTR